MATILRVTVRNSFGVVEIQEREIVKQRERIQVAAIAATLVSDAMERHLDAEHITIERLLGDKPCNT